MTLTKVSQISVAQMAYMGIIEARMDNLTLSLPLADWASLFRTVNRASNNKLAGLMQAGMIR